MVFGTKTGTSVDIGTARLPGLAALAGACQKLRWCWRTKHDWLKHDWFEVHHDVELMDATGRTLAKARLAEGVAGMARLHTLVGDQLGEDVDDVEVGSGGEF
jgi:hypothetical protein